MRNTADKPRAVVPVRLSAAEREQIAGAAARLEVTLSGFVRQSALQASARIERKVSVQEAEPERPSIVLFDSASAGHWVEGELVPSSIRNGEEPRRAHHFEGETCIGCGLAIADIRGRDLPCIREAA